MKLTQIRNATILLEVSGRTLIVDPMLAPRHALPKLKYFRSNRRNPLVDLPSVFDERQLNIDGCLITHCQKGHFDHLDRAGVRWLQKHQIPTYCTDHDDSYLRKKGINTAVLASDKDRFLQGSILQVPATHTRGWLTPFMEHGVGYYIEQPNEPSLYLMGDTVMTDEIRAFIANQQPNYIVAPTGKAQFDLGAPLLLDENEIIELAQLAQGTIIANHMEALDHCRLSRADLENLLSNAGLLEKFIIPDDGQSLELTLA